MFTVCPKCALTLVVTAADLRVAQGYVRCGRCSSVFNALARLTDERQAAALEQSPAPAAEDPPLRLAPTTQSTAPAQKSDDDLTDDALEFDPTRTDAAAVFVEPPPSPEWTAATGSFKARLAAGQEPPSGQRNEAPATGQVDVEIDADLLASMLEDASGRPPATESQTPPPAPAPTKAPAPAPRQVASRTAATPAPERRVAKARAASGAPTTAAVPPPRGADRGNTPAAAAPTATARVAPAGARPRHAASHTRPPQAALKTPVPPRARTSPAAVPPAHTPHEPDDSAAAAGELSEESAAPPAAQHVLDRMLQQIGPRGWTVGAVLAALVLLVQIVNHNRDELAASARFNRPLTALYAALGVQLTPHWDLRAYDVRQLGASVAAGGGGLITVRASIKNSAPQAQPLPLLRVTLQDRFGNRIAARDVAPRFYLPHSMPASSFISGGQRIDAQMGFVDPGANAVGFEIDACLPASGGGIACANDANAR